LQDGFYVNLGIGIPTLVASFIPEESMLRCSRKTAFSAWAFSARKRSGSGPDQRWERDGDIPSGCSDILERDSFAMIRGGHIDLAILGAMQVSERGDLANWMIPGKRVKGMGGAMDSCRAFSA